MAFTRRLAQYARDRASFEALSEEVVERSKEMIINAAAVGLAGAAQPESQAITQFVQEMGGNGKCTIIGVGLRTSPVYAALANGAMVRCLDFDDEIPRRGSHPSSAVLPAVLAVAEPLACSGKEMLAAYALGCEVASKLGGLGHLATLEVSPPVRGWDRDGVAGTIGATVAVGRLLGLDQESLENAIGIAAGAAAGIQANFVSASQALQCGRAALNGVMAVALAQRGVGSARQSLEAPGGFLETFYGGVPEGEEDFFQRLGQPYDVVEPGVALKLYPCASASHTAIEAVIQLVQQYRLSPEQVASARVRVPPATLAALPFPTPQNGWEARYCLSYLVAASLVQGQPLIDTFTEASLQDARVREMMDRVSVEATMAATPTIPQPSEVTLALADGRQVHHRVDFARGLAEFPLDSQELDAKFLYCTRYILPPQHIEESILRFRDLENIENVSGLISVLGA